MAGNSHRYSLQMRWTGNQGEGTANYRSYARSFDLVADGKPTLHGSADATFRGDRARWNPEEMLLAALSSCHMLSFLHVCAEAGVNVVAYSDAPDGEMVLRQDGAGQFTRVTLRPQVELAAGSDLRHLDALHHTAHEKCFIANSVNFPVMVQAIAAQEDAHPLADLVAAV